MSPQQSKILSEARKFRYFYSEINRKRDLIPDTCTARKWALAQGATHFSALSFNRPDETGLPTARRWGDFYFRVESTDFGRIKEALASIVNFLRLDPRSVKVTYLDPHVVGVSVPQSYFPTMEKLPCLPDYYQALAHFLARQIERPFDPAGPDLRHNAGMDADNRPLSVGGYAIPLRLNEYLAMSEDDLHQRSANPCPLEDFRCDQRISNNLHKELIKQAANLRIRTTVTGTPWPSPIPLVTPHGASACGSSRSLDGVKCAIRLVAWCRNQGVYEFTQRNVLTVFDRIFTLDQGVSEALTILSAHNFVRECPFPTFSYPGRRPRWFVVNPSVFSTPSLY